jgi:hypothetical protein
MRSDEHDVCARAHLKGFTDDLRSAARRTFTLTNDEMSSRTRGA